MSENNARGTSADIRAHVDEGAIGSVTRFFDASDESVFCELYQNARRAGATRIAVEIDGGTATVTDDGRGIADPAIVLAFGRSDQPGLGHEHPAGMGLYALARRTAEIRSRAAGRPGWRVRLAAEHWRGEKSAAVWEDTATEAGTMVRFESKSRYAESAADSKARYLPIPVTINGKRVKQLKFGDGEQTRWRRQDDDVTIVVQATRNHMRPRSLAINFFGHVIHDEVEPPSVETIDGHWYAGIDVTDCPGLELVLPARQQVVRNAFLEELKTRIERAVFEGMAAERFAVRVPHATWTRGRELGVDLRVAPPALRPWRARTADRELAGTERENREHQLLPDDPIVVDERVGSPGQAVLEYAIENDPVTARRLVTADPRYEGFDWYDKLDRLVDITVEIVENGKAALTSEGKWQQSRRVDALAVLGTVRTAAGSTQMLRVPTDAALGETDCPCEPGVAGILVAHNAQIDGERIERMATRGLFVPDEHSESSASTQREVFNEQLHYEMTRALETPERAIAVAMRRALRRGEARLPKDRDTIVRFGADGKTSVEFGPQRETAHG